MTDQLRPEVQALLSNANLREILEKIHFRLNMAVQHIDVLVDTPPHSSKSLMGSLLILADYVQETGDQLEVEIDLLATTITKQSQTLQAGKDGEQNAN